MSDCPCGRGPRSAKGRKCRTCLTEQLHAQRAAKRKRAADPLDAVEVTVDAPDPSPTAPMPPPRPEALRIVTLDIETAPLESYHWGLWDQNIGLEQINVEWSILSFSAKWLGDPEVIYDDTSGRGAGMVRNDLHLLKRLWDILDRADIVVAQNGKAFDIKKINARMILSGLPPYSPIKIVDTMLVSKRHFEFTSNKLAWLSKYMTPDQKSEHKEFPGFTLWAECLKDNPRAWAQMKHYNCLDTIATEQLYLKLRPWIEGHPNVAAYIDGDERRCPKCGSDKLHHYGHARTQSGLYDRFKCGTCGGFSRSRYTKNSIEKRQSLLSN